MGIWDLVEIIILGIWYLDPLQVWVYWHLTKLYQVFGYP
jgi:hypothetical protein